jgi:hypothetical protein
MGIDLGIFVNPNLLPFVKIGISTFHFLPHFLIQSDALAMSKNAFLLVPTLRGFTKPTMSTLELVKNGGVGVLLTMSSIHNMFSTFTKFD